MQTRRTDAPRPMGRTRRNRGRRNLIVAVVAAMVTSFLTIATAPAVGAAELVDVNVGLSGDDGVVITWETDVATSAAIVYGTTPEYGEAWLDPAISTTHSAQR